MIVRNRCSACSTILLIRKFFNNLTHTVDCSLQAQLAVKTVFTAAFVLMAAFMSMRLVLILILLVGNVAIAVMYSWQMPHFRYAEYLSSYFMSINCQPVQVFTWF